MYNKDNERTIEGGVINIYENYDVEYWSDRLGIRPQNLREIVKTTGNKVKQVLAYLNK